MDKNADASIPRAGGLNQWVWDGGLRICIFSKHQLILLSDPTENHSPDSPGTGSSGALLGRRDPGGMSPGGGRQEACSGMSSKNPLLSLLPPQQGGTRREHHVPRDLRHPWACAWVSENVFSPPPPSVRRQNFRAVVICGI